MEKTIQITIAATQFLLTEPAYEKLAAYLESLKKHFAAEDDQGEILRDIESRIAEKLLEKKHRVTTEPEIAGVIAEMGDASELGGGEESPQAAQPSFGAARKLYRDTDSQIVGGVASGIAAYFGIDLTLVRILFIVSMFFGGAGLWLYILLYIFIPPAISVSQKLEMHGAPVTLETISRSVKDGMSTAAERGTFAKILFFPFRVAGTLLRLFAERLFPILGKLAGAALAAGSFAAALGLTAALAAMGANWDKMDAPIREAVSGGLLWTAIVAGYVAVLIPLFFVFLLGYRLLLKKNAISSPVGFGIVGVWCLAVVILGASATRALSAYSTEMATNPNYQEVSEPVAVAPFTAIKSTGVRVTVQSGAAQQVLIEGQRQNLDQIHAEVVDGTLVLSQSERKEDCFFCDTRPPAVVIIAPSLAAIEADSGSVFFDDFSDEALDLTMQNGRARGKLSSPLMHLTLENSGIDATLQADTLTLKGRNSWFDLRGSAKSADIALDDSNLDAGALVLGNAAVSAFDSFAQLYVEDELTVNDDSNSTVENRKTP